MHCFTGDASQAAEALDLGFHLGFGGVLTFPKAEAVREAARITPDDRLLVETDAPTWRRFRIAASATSRPSWWRPRGVWRRCAAPRLEAHRRGDHAPISNGCCLRAGPANG